MNHVLRRLGRTPLFTSAALLTLGAGIGACTAIFSLVQAVLLKPLPYPRSEELISIMHSAGGLNIRELPVSPACYFLYRAEGRAFQDIALWTRDSVSVTGHGEPEEVRALDVTDGMLPILGVHPALGRGFTLRDDTPGNPGVVMLSHGYWLRRFGGDPRVIGRTLVIDAVPREIIGVLPGHFRFPGIEAGILLPLQLNQATAKLGNFSYSAIARLKPGAGIAAASEDIARMIPLLYQRFPPPQGSSVKMFEDTRMAPALRTLKRDVVGNAGTFLWVLLAAIAIVLLIANANVANLMLVRVEARNQELAVRKALGAGWGALARDLMAESLILAAGGGLIGLAVAFAGLRALVAVAPANLPRIAEVSIDPAVMFFAAAVSVVCGLLFGILPVLKYRGGDIAPALRLGVRTLGLSRDRQHVRSSLVVVQVALAMVLLSSAGLMLRTFRALHGVPPGFSRPQEILTMTINIPEAQVPAHEQVLRMQYDIAGRMAQVPGVSGVSFASRVPMDDNGSYDSLFVEDQPAPAGRLAQPRQMKFAAPGFFRTMGNPLVAGRDITWDDAFQTRHVVVVNETLARQLWARPENAIGKRVRESQASPWREVIGVVGDEYDKGVDKPAPATVYWPAMTADFWGRKTLLRRTVTFVIRSARTGSEAFAGDIRRAVWAVNPDLPVAGMRSMNEIYSRSMTRTSFAMVLLSIAGVMALLIGWIGIYSVIAYTVSQRTREIGIRIAMGAERGAVSRMFTARGVRLAMVGVGSGVLASAILTRAMSSLLFGVRALDPLTYALVAVLVVTAAGAASYLPAYRAARVDPVDALRAG